MVGNEKYPITNNEYPMSNYWSLIQISLNQGKLDIDNWIFYIGHFFYIYPEGADTY